MDLENLKSVWKEANTRKESGAELDAEQIMAMLSKRSRSIIEKIDLNVKVGFGIMCLLIILMLADSTVLGSVYETWIEDITHQSIEIPSWILVLGYLQIALAILGCVTFGVNYKKTRYRNITSENMKEALTGYIKIFSTLKRMTKILLAIFAIILGLGLATGLHTGLKMSLNEVSTTIYLLVAAVGLLMFVLIMTGVYKLLQMSFKRLFGQYLKKLNSCLSELDGI